MVRLTQGFQNRSVDEQISMLERELERVIDLPTTPSTLRAQLIERLAVLKARAADRPPAQH
jgi:hypothetical protein